MKTAKILIRTRQSTYILYMTPLLKYLLRLTLLYVFNIYTLFLNPWIIRVYRIYIIDDPPSPAHKSGSQVFCILIIFLCLFLIRMESIFQFYFMINLSLLFGNIPFLTTPLLILPPPLSIPSCVRPRGNKLKCFELLSIEVDRCIAVYTLYSSGVYAMKLKQ